jgi:hypothetical protein
MLSTYHGGSRMNAEMYIEKHQYIRKDLEEIVNATKSGIGERTAESIANAVNRLSGVLLMHLRKSLPP